MFEQWPFIMGNLGAPKVKHWWTELWERGKTVEEGDNAVMDET